ncbi:MAG: SUMF1/EgtB/PvdO family nonheme iron enzyme [Chloroflexi bacterium]|nr:SUMF1/EgtB/PvdO family nonheme iron enzyme [Chloroflexota bacterium]
MPRIFISYRRADSRKDAGRLYDRLVGTFGKEYVFKDIESIPIGSDFRGVLREAVAQCQVFLAVIGKNWLAIQDVNGNRRLDNPQDFVRVELETALERDTCIVIPILVDNASMPAADELPLVLRELAFKNAAVMRDDPDFHNDVTKLIRGIETRFGTTTAAIKGSVNDFNIHVAITRFYEQFDAKDWSGARITLGDIRSSGKAPRVFNVDQLEREIWAAIEAEEREKEYDILRLMSRRANKEQVWSALLVFWESFPKYDPDHIADLVRPQVQRSQFSGSKKNEVLYILPEPFAWIDIPSGNVILDVGGYLNRGTVLTVPAFTISKYPITNGQYQVFIDDVDGYSNSKWWDYSDDAFLWHKSNPRPQDRAFESDDHPRANVSWYEAVAFTRWLGNKLSETIRLPYEAEWQRAAQGDDNRIFPWGNDWYGSRCNNSVGKDWRKGSTSSVSQYEGIGDSPFGVVDMTGNVWEWTGTAWEHGDHDLVGSNKRVVRGGSWYGNYPDWFRVTLRDAHSPNNGDNYGGFRCIRVIT